MEHLIYPRPYSYFVAYFQIKSLLVQFRISVYLSRKNVFLRCVKERERASSGLNSYLWYKHEQESNAGAHD